MRLEFHTQQVDSVIMQETVVRSTIESITNPSHFVQVVFLLIETDKFRITGGYVIKARPIDLIYCGYQLCF